MFNHGFINKIVRGFRKEADTPPKPNYDYIRIKEIIVMYALYHVGEPICRLDLSRICLMKEGELYPLLYRLSEWGLIKSTEIQYKNRIRVLDEPIVSKGDFYEHTKDTIKIEIARIQFLQEQLEDIREDK